MKIKFRDFSIKKKYVLLLSICMVIPICIISGILYSRISRNWIEKEYVDQTTELGSIMHTTELQLDRYEKSLRSIYENMELLKTLQKGKQEKNSLDYVKMTESMRSIQQSEKYIESVYVFLDTGEVFFQDDEVNGNYKELYYRNQNWKEQIQEKNGGIVWIPSFHVNNKVKGKDKTYFSCAAMVKDIIGDWKTIGNLVLNIDISLFDSLFESLGNPEDGTTYSIVDDSGIVIWSNELEGGATLEKDFFDELQKSAKVSAEYEYQGEDKIVSKYKSEYNGWNYVSMKNKSIVLESATWIWTTVAVQLMIILLFSILGALLTQKYIIKPIQKMVVVMSLPEKALNKRLEITQHDEIGKLYQSFNEMNKKIEELIRKNNESNKREREYHIQALNAQINPHFIYNTLDTLNWLALDIQAFDMSKLITSFSSILRYSISKKENIVTLENEIQCIKNYIEIYTERYERIFEAEFCIDEKIYAYKTFKMLLQPIVENCIVHGFSQSMEGGMIQIVGEMDGQEAVIRVKDNGCGMDRARIDYVLMKDSDRIGLSNINQRLKLLYGEDYGLKIVSEKGAGTEIVLRFPPSSLDF